MVKNNRITFCFSNYCYFLFFMIVPTSIVFCNDKTPKVGVLVVTVGRSGSSCLSGVLQILGVPFGSNVLQKEKHNPKGFFENKTISMLNSIILGDASFFTFNPQFIEWDTHPKKRQYITVLMKNLEEEFREFSIFGIKNLELGYLLPLYVEALESLGYSFKVIIALRNPYKVCRSFLSWEELNSTALSVYQRMAVQFSMVLKYIFDMDTIAIDYDDLLSNPKVVVDKITAFIPGLRNYQEAKEDLDAFIDVNLNHH